MISFRFDREIKSFTVKKKLRELSTTKATVQQMLKNLAKNHKRRKRSTKMNSTRCQSRFKCTILDAWG